MSRFTLSRSEIRAEVERRTAGVTPPYGIIDAPQEGQRHSMRRHRGVYIWRPAMDQRPETGNGDELIGMADLKTAETQIQRLQQKPH
jgi:hypothetical protein